MPNKDDETRRQRNERVGEYTPPFEIPSGGEYLWNIHQSLMKCVNRNSEGSYHIIPPTEVEAWIRLTGTLVYPGEYDILMAMDRIYCEEANKELEDIRARQDEERKRNAEQQSRWKWRRGNR